MTNISESNKTFLPICKDAEIYFFDVPRNYHVFLLFFFVVNAVVALAAIICNTLVIYVILRTPLIRTPSNVLILGLAASDLCAGVFSQSCYAISILAEYNGDKSLFCSTGIVFQSSGWMLTSVSFFTLTTVAGDRFLAIHLHLRYVELVTNKRYTIVLISLWVTGVTISLLKNLLFTRVVIFLGISVFVIVLFLNIFFMWKISRVIHRHSVEIQAQQQVTQQSINMPRYKKSVNTMYYVIGAFMLSYLPMGISFGVFAVAQRMTIEVRGVFKVANTLVLCNGLMNPIIYCWRIEEIRNAARRLLLWRQNATSNQT